MAKPSMAGYGLNSSMSLEDMRKAKDLAQMQQLQEQVRIRGNGQAPTTWADRAGILSNQLNEAVGWTSEAKNAQQEAALQSSIPNPYNAAQPQVSPQEQQAIADRTAQGPMTGYGKNPAGPPPMPQYAQQAQAEQAKSKMSASEIAAEMENESFPTPGAPPYSPPSKPLSGTMSVSSVEDFSTPGGINATAAPMQAGAAGVITPGKAPSLEGYGAGPAGVPTPGNSMAGQGSIVSTKVPVTPSTPVSANGLTADQVPDIGGMTTNGQTGWNPSNALSPANAAGASNGPPPPLIDPTKPQSATLGGITGAANSLSGYGAGYKAPPASSTASAPNSTWTGANTAALAQSYNPMPQSYVGGAPSGSFGGVGGGGSYGGGYQQPQFNAPQAPSFGGASGGAATGQSSTAPVPPQFTTSSTQPASSSSSSQTSSSSSSSRGPELPADKLKAAQELADKEWQQGQDMIASEKATADKAAEDKAAAAQGLATTTDSKAETDKIAADYQKAQDSATKANEDRYAQGMAGYGDRYTRNMATEASRTDQDYKDLDRSEKAALASNQQSLTNRGLGNSTIVDTTRRGITDQFAMLRNRLGDQRINQKVALDAGLSGDTLKFLEGRSDVAPDLQQLLALAQLIGQRPTVAS